MKALPHCNPKWSGKVRELIFTLNIYFGGVRAQPLSTRAAEPRRPQIPAPGPRRTHNLTRPLLAAHVLV